MKRKIILTLTLAIMLIVVLALSVNAAEPVESWDVSQNTDGSVMAYLYNDTQNEGMYTLTVRGNGNMKNWTSSSKAPWYSSHRNTITSVTVEEGVTTIGGYAFYSCESLTSVVIPDSVTTIGSYAFCDCTSLQSIVIPDSVTSLGNRALANCKSLKSATISCNASISSALLNGCGKLEALRIPYCNFQVQTGDYFDKYYHYYTLGYIFGQTQYDNSVAVEQRSKLIYRYALTTPEQRTETIKYYFPSNLKKVEILGGDICDGALQNCNSLVSIGIGKDVTSIGQNAFSGCSSLREVHIKDIGSWCNISFSSNPLTYAETLLLNGECLMDVIIPEGVERIGFAAFYNCKTIKSIYIPSSVKEISDKAFKGCSSLKELIIPNSVSKVGLEILAGCSSLEKLKIPSVSLTYKQEITPPFSSYVYYYPIGFIFGAQSYERAVCVKQNYISIYNDKLSGISNQTKIESKNYYFPESLKSITVASKTIDSYAFSNCNNFLSIILTSNVEKISATSFAGCEASIYTEVSSKPSGWDSNWNSKCPVTWDYKNTMQNDIFTFKGYSFGPNGSMAVGYGIDYEALSLYEELTGKTLKIGVAFASLELLGGQNPIDNQGNAITLDVGRIANRDLTDLDFTSYDFVINGITEDLTNYSLVIAAYINDGTVTKYVQQNGLSDNVSGITYNEAKESIAV